MPKESLHVPSKRLVSNTSASLRLSTSTYVCMYMTPNTHIIHTYFSGDWAEEFGVQLVAVRLQRVVLVVVDKVNHTGELKGLREAILAITMDDTD